MLWSRDGDDRRDLAWRPTRCGRGRGGGRWLRWRWREWRPSQTRYRIRGRRDAAGDPQLHGLLPAPLELRGGALRRGHHVDELRRARRRAGSSVRRELHRRDPAGEAHDESMAMRLRVELPAGSRRQLRRLPREELLQLLLTLGAATSRDGLEHAPTVNVAREGLAGRGLAGGP